MPTASKMNGGTAGANDEVSEIEVIGETQSSSSTRIDEVLPRSKSSSGSLKNHSQTQALTCRSTEQEADAILNTDTSPIVSIESLSAEVQQLRRRNKELQLQCDSITAGAISHKEDPSSSLKDEHRIFVRAILDLLTTRDQLAIEAKVHDPSTIKAGSLRKASHRIKGLWKKKYVEIRNGTFSYFEDSAKQRSNRNDQMSCLRKKDIPLKMLCTCQAVKLRSAKILPGNSGGAVFELRIQGGSRRLWMAPTREERQSWIQAIHHAVPGASPTTGGDNHLEYQGEQACGKKKKMKNTVPLNSPHSRSLDQYLGVRAASLSAKSKNEYLDALSCLRGQKVSVPVSWIKLQIHEKIAAASFFESEIASSVDQLWKDLLRDSVEINGCIITAGPDRILGALTQQILLSDALFRGKSKSHRKTCAITEAEAVSHARDILLASNRTRSGGDSYYTAENLCLNRNLAILCPSSTEASPLSIKVSACTQENSKDTDIPDISGWVSGRRRRDETWKRQYLVLSQSVLSCYAEEPLVLLESINLHGVKVGRSSLAPEVMNDSVLTLNVSIPEYILNIATKDDQLFREYLFEDEFDFMIWHASFQKSACNLRGSASSAHAPSDLSIPSSIECEKITPSVDVLVNACTEYKLCTLDPSGIESEDTWA